MAANSIKIADPTPQVDVQADSPTPVIAESTSLPQFKVDTPYVSFSFDNETASREFEAQETQALLDNLVPLYGIGDVVYQAPVEPDDSTALNRAIYGFRKGKSMLGNLYTASQAAYNTPEYHNGKLMPISEKFNLSDDQWNSMLYRDKVKMIRDAEDSELRAKYPKAAAAFDQGRAGVAGNLAEFIAMLGIESVIAFPASVTRSAVATGLASGAFGAGYSVSEDLGNARDIDFSRAAFGATVGGVAGAGIVKAGQALRKRKEKQIKEFEYKYDEQVLDDANLAAAIAVTQNIPKNKIPELVESQFGHTPEVVQAAKQRTGRKVTTPKTTAEAQFMVRAARDAAEGQFSSKGKTRKLAERMFVPILSRIENISPALAMSLNKLELNRHTKLFNFLSGERDRKVIANAKNIAPEKVQIGAGDFLSSIGKLSKDDQYLAFLRARKGDEEGLRSLISKVVGKEAAAEQVSQVRSVINKVGDDLVNIGVLKSEDRLQNYFPTLVKDVNGLMMALGKDKRVGQQNLTNYINTFARERGLDNIEQVAPEAVAEFLNKVATGQVQGIRGGKISYTSARTMDEIPKEYYKYYATLEDSIYDFVTKGVDMSEQAKFLGLPNLIKAKNKTGLDIEDKIDVAASLTRKLDTELPALPSDAQAEIVSILSSRFGKGQETPSAVVKILRDIGYAFTLANPFSALIQLSDVGLSMWMNGTVNTLRGIMTKKQFDMLEFGLADTVQAIAANPRDLSKTLNTFMRVSGFQKLDRVGKNIYMNAAWQRVQKQVKSKEGLEKLAKKYKTAYGDEYDSLISAVKAGNTADENVRLLMWQELSDAQPISLSKTPQTSLNNPDGRIFYALKMFALNQLNLVGRQTYKKIRSKNPAERAEGYKMTAMLLPTVAFAGASVAEIRKWLKNGMSGFDEESFPASMGEHMLKMVGASYWTIEQIQKGNLGGAAGSYLGIPAFGVGVDAFTGAKEAFSEGITTDNTFIRRLPVVGNLFDVIFNSPDSALRQEKIKPSY